MNEILNNISNAIQRYQTLKLALTHDQSEILRDLTTNLAQLEEYRSEYYLKWLDCYFSLEGSDAFKVKKCDKEVPELQMIRKIMRGGYKVVDSIRSTISVNKV